MMEFETFIGWKIKKLWKVHGSYIIKGPLQHWNYKNEACLRVSPRHHLGLDYSQEYLVNDSMHDFVIQVNLRIHVQ